MASLAAPSLRRCAGMNLPAARPWPLHPAPFASFARPAVKQKTSQVPRLRRPA